MGAKAQTRNRVVIAGQLSNAETGQVIHRARVEITKMPDSFKNWLTLRAMQYGANWETMVERPDRTQTAIDGHFHFLDLPDGDYTLTASLPSAGTRYGAVEKKFQVSRNGDRIKLAAADITLPPTGIKGQITNAENQPIVMAKVQVKGTKESTFSDSKGNYLLSGLEVSNVQFTVRFSAQAYQQNFKDIQLCQGEVKTLNSRLNKLR
jgi:hypothetical protein